MFNIGFQRTLLHVENTYITKYGETNLLCLILKGEGDEDQHEKCQATVIVAKIGLHYYQGKTI